MPHTLFISDLHLGVGQPSSMAVFQRFITRLTSDPSTMIRTKGLVEAACPENSRRAEALYILGDLFDHWAGDDDLEDTFHIGVVAALRNLTRHGTKVYLLHGNRDLLMGEALAEACHATLLKEPVLIDLYGTATLLCHGDTLCTDDVEYQRYRVQVHDTDFQRQFLAMPLAERKAYIAQLRVCSRAEKQIKDSAIMDVNGNAVATLLREYGYPRLIHGHTHRPGRHEHIVDGHKCERWVLGEWNQQGSALRCDRSGIRWETV